MLDFRGNCRSFDRSLQRYILNIIVRWNMCYTHFIRFDYYIAFAVKLFLKIIWLIDKTFRRNL